jgi:methionyl-tRNA formyltransferase
MTGYWTPKTLLVSDPALGPRAERVLRQFFPDLVAVIWDIHSEPDTQARSIVAGGRWDLVFSVHNDLLFSAREIACMGLALNLHPALPRIRGIGHDVIPIIEQHPDVGVTLHEIVERVDSGMIFHAERLPLPPDASRSCVRKITQALSLDVLEWTARLVKQTASVREAREALRTQGNGATQQWGDISRTRKQLARLVEDIRRCEPMSPILQ